MTAPTIETAGGTLRGYSDRGVQVFKAIPYGASTGGWRAPFPSTPSRVGVVRHT